MSAKKQIKDYQRKYDAELVGNEYFIIQEVANNHSLTKSTTLFDIHNHGIQYTYNIEGPNKPYPLKTNLTLDNELILIKDISDNFVKYTTLNQLRANMIPQKEVSSDSTFVNVDFMKAGYWLIRTDQCLLDIDLSNYSSTKVMEVIIEAVNFAGKKVNWLKNVRWENGAIAYSSLQEDRDSVDLIKIIATRYGFFGFFLAKNLF